MDLVVDNRNGYAGDLYFAVGDEVLPNNLRIGGGLCPAVRRVRKDTPPRRGDNGNSFLYRTGTIATAVAPAASIMFDDLSGYFFRSEIRYRYSPVIRLKIKYQNSKCKIEEVIIAER